MTIPSIVRRLVCRASFRRGDALTTTATDTRAHTRKKRRLARSELELVDIVLCEDEGFAEENVGSLDLHVAKLAGFE